MPIDVSVALGAALPDRKFSWDESDVLLYHLAIGACSRAGAWLDPGALRYTYEGGELQVLPSFAVVAPTLHETAIPSLEIPGCEFDLRSVLHGGQDVVLDSPIPKSGEATLKSRIVDIWDTSSAAVIAREGQAFDPAGKRLWTVRDTIYVRGEGGWGGSPSPRSSVVVPDRPADAETEYGVLPQQALLYRLCGDRNPLHVDPEFARSAGLPRPILHGLCTFGIVLREATDALLGGDAREVEGFSARFVGVVYPGEALRLRAWETAHRITMTAGVEDSNAPGGERRVLADCVLTKRSFS